MTRGAMKQYSARERFACGFLAVVCLLAAGFWTYFLLTDAGTRRSVSAWAAGLGFGAGFALCLKIAMTGRSTARLEQDAADALAGRPVSRETKRPD